MTLTISIVALCQNITHTDSVRYCQGVKFLYGIDCSLNYDSAHRAFSKLTLKKYADAYFQLGYMTTKGFGCQKNEHQAYLKFRKANRLGSMRGSIAYAYCLRHGDGVEQDYFKAFSILDSCAQLGFAPAQYAVGEMLYKGYGTEQSYQKAIEYFEKGAKQKDKNSLYMLGVAAAEGFGMTQNIDKVQKYLAQALMRGHGWVEDVIEQHILDSVNIAANNRVRANIDATDTLHLVSNNIEEKDLVNSYWEGILTTYDWSGQYIAQEIPIKMSLNKNLNDTIIVEWSEFTHDSYTFKLFKCDGIWQVKDFEQTMRVHNNYTIRGIQLGMKGEQLCGTLCRYSRSTKDRQMPSYFTLKQVAETDYETQTSNIAINKIYPNPFERQIQIYISLKNDDNLKIELFDMKGKLIYRQLPTNYKAGNFAICFESPSLDKGQYIVKLSSSETTIARTLQHK